MNITAEDQAGNKAYVEEDVNGPFAGLWSPIVDTFIGLLKAVVSFVLAALSFLWGIVWKIIKPIIDAVLAPIITEYNQWIADITNEFSTAISQSTSKDGETILQSSGSNSYLSAFNAIFESGFVDLITAFTIGLTIVYSIVGAFLVIAGGFAKGITDKIANIIMEQFIESAMRVAKFTTLSTLVTVGTASIVTVAVSLLAPETPIGIEIIEMASALNSYIVHNKIGGGLFDSTGLVYSFVGMMLTFGASAVASFSYDIAYFISAVAVGLSALAAHHSFKQKDILDRTIGAPMALIEEIVGLIVTIYAGLEFVNYLALIVEG